MQSNEKFKIGALISDTTNIKLNSISSSGALLSDN